MPEVIISDKSIHEPPVSELHPLRTTVQGTQQDGVEFGHEHRDIDARAIARWFVILGGIVLFTYASMMWMLRESIEYQAKGDRLPSPLAPARQVPPAPYIEGLTLAGPAKAGTHEHLREVRAKEDATLEKWGLTNAESAKTGRRTAPIPDSVVQMVAREGEPVPSGGNAATAPYVERDMPTEASGGLRTNIVQGEIVH